MVKKKEEMMKVITSGRPSSFGHDSVVSIFKECGELKAPVFCFQQHSKSRTWNQFYCQFRNISNMRFS